MGSRYREMEIRTATPEMLVVKMYEGAIRFAREAREMHAAGRIAERGAAISRALAIIAELRQSLDHRVGGEIAGNLESLYVFVSDQLIDANLSGRMESIANVIQVLEQLLSAWVEIAKSPPSQAATSAPAPR